MCFRKTCAKCGVSFSILELFGVRVDDLVEKDEVQLSFFSIVMVKRK